MRAVFLSIVLSALAFSFDANAATNGDIYKFCKKYADRSFEYKEPTDLVCVGYFGAVRDFGQTICNTWLKQAENAQLTEAKIEIKLFLRMHGISSPIDMNAAIQSYINTMQKYPQLWAKQADFNVQESIQALAPCE